MKYLVLLVVAAFAIARGWPQWDFSATGGTQVNPSRIVNGHESVQGSNPWQVVMFGVSSRGGICGGSLITQKFVLTAAHCGGLSSYKVYIGVHDITKASEPGRIEMVATVFIQHEHFNSQTLDNDIGLLKLPLPVPLSGHIKTISLPHVDNVHVGDLVTASGWGWTTDLGMHPQISPVLLEVDLTTEANENCVAVHGPTTPHNIICVDTEGPHGTCYGDSGGPLAKHNGQQWEIVGITSFIAQGGCESELPAAFTKVFPYKAWISNHTGLKM